MEEKKITPLYRFIRALVRLFSPKMELVGAEKLPQGATIIVGNHCQMYGPIACELYASPSSYIWCAGQMMRLKEVPGYAFDDFWSQKPRYTHWFYKLLSYLIAPLSVCVFNNARTIPVYHDSRLLTTFRQSIADLQQGASLVIFPEHDKRRSNILYDFQDKFVDTARLYYKKTGEELSFVPLYIAPKLKKMVFGEPIRFRADAPIAQERRRVCDELMRSIEEMACALPVHTVVPYRNIKKRDYPKNLPYEVYADESTRC